MPIGSDDEYRRTKIEAEEFEQAIASARGREQAMIESLESELAMLREQLDEHKRRRPQR